MTSKPQWPWIVLNFIESQTEVMIHRPSCSSSAPKLDLGPVDTYVNNPSVKMGCDLNMDKQIISVVKSGFYQTRLLSKVKPSLSFNNFDRVMHTFISTWLDSYNALYVGINQACSKILQLAFIAKSICKRCKGNRNWMKIWTDMFW